MIKPIANELLDDLGIYNKEFVMEVVTQESRANPIDTGLSSANWFVSKSQLATVYKTPNVGIAGPSTSQVRARSKLDQFTKKLSTIFIQNNINYVEELNAGSSRQAPAGWVDVALMNALNKYYPR